jgi:biotin transport system substrate-specific component
MPLRAARLDASVTLLGALAGGRNLVRAIQFAAVLFVTALTAAAAQVSVPLPFTPVPFTLQPMVVLLGGAALGSRLGMASQVLYLLLGVAGLPVFAASPVLPQGILRLVGPTGGYLMSYPLAALVTGTLAERGFDRRYLTSVLAMTAGLAVIFTCGIVWLAWLTTPAAAGLGAALRTGLYPFLPADIVKICAAAAILPGVWRFVGPRGLPDVSKTA